MFRVCKLRQRILFVSLIFLSWQVYLFLSIVQYTNDIAECFQLQFQTPTPETTTPYDPDAFSPISIGFFLGVVPKKILMWTKYFDFSPVWVVNNWRSPEKLPGPNWYRSCYWPCRVIFNKSELEDADAVIFHAYNLNKSSLPRRYTEDQIWIYLNEEAPPALQWDVQERQHEVNWTMTYRTDADVYHPYGYLREKPFMPYMDLSHQRYLNTLRAELRNKSGVALWTAGNCKSRSQREVLILRLRKYISIDVYGKCGRQSCTGEWPDGCLADLSSKYKFYFAMENAFCKDYVTEKFFRALQVNILPIVFGMANYQKIAPKGSYVNALDFLNIEALGRHLQYLDSNEEAYLEHFSWKRNYSIMSGGFGWCTLCEKLWGRNTSEKKWYSDLWSWENFEDAGDTIYRVGGNSLSQVKDTSSSKTSICAYPTPLIESLFKD